MRRSSQYGRHPEVNQAVVDSVSRSCLKSRAAESVTFLVCIKNGCRHPTRRGSIPVDVCVDKNVAFLHLYKCYRAWIFRLFNLLFKTRTLESCEAPLRLAPRCRSDTLITPRSRNAILKSFYFLIILHWIENVSKRCIRVLRLNNF